MHRRHLKHLLFALLFIIVAGCSGGGCSSGCAGCGLQPLAAPFPVGKRIENAASLRLTQSGLAFLQTNVGTLAGQLLPAGTGGQNGVITFAIPKSSGSTSGVDYTICTSGTCNIEIDLAQSTFVITPAYNHDIVVTGNLKIRLASLPVDFTALGFISGGINVTLSNNKDCNNPDFGDVALNPGVDVSIQTETNQANTSRYGYSKVKIEGFGFDSNGAIGKVQLCSNGGVLSWIISALQGVVVPALGGSLTSALGGLTSTLGDQLCTKSDASNVCPAGATASGAGAICKFADGSCVSPFLGIDGHLDLTSAVASISPGTTGAADMVFSLGGLGVRDDNPAGKSYTYGELDPQKNGATLSLVGGLEASPLSKCVPLSKMAVPTGIPVPSLLRDNTVPGWPSAAPYGPAPHIGLGISERYANYALAQLYNSGLLCLALTTDTIPSGSFSLSTGLFALLGDSIPTLALQKQAAPIAIILRPSQPPNAKFGNGSDIKTDPTLLVTLPALNLDMYVWSSDRFVRAFTTTMDLAIPVNLSQTSAGLTPQLGDIKTSNVKGSNGELLTQPADDVAKALASVLGGLGGQLGGAINPIDLNSQVSSFGLTLNIPPSVAGKGSPGITKLTQGSDNYLGLFMTLGTVKATPKVVSALRVIDRKIEAAGVRLATIDDSNAPAVTLLVTPEGDDGSRAFEHTWRIDRGMWHVWTDARQIDVRDPLLRLQGKHTIEVVSRVAGVPESESATPVSVVVVVDVDAPKVAIARLDDERVRVDASDLVSGDALDVRFSVDGAAFGEWSKLADVASISVAGAHDVRVEVRDEEGNIGTAQESLIRGRPDPALATSGSSGCGCRVGGDTRGPRGAFGVIALGAAIAAVVARRRSRASRVRDAAVAAGVVAIAGSYAGCSCGAADDPVDQTPADDAGVDAPSDAQEAAVDTGVDAAEEPTGPELTVLDPGIVGSYTSAAVDSTGAVWVSGYNEADWANKLSYGDLVVGKWDATKKKVAWTSVDGVPATPAPDPTVYDTTGWRGGQTSPGEDVGLWTSIAVGADDKPMVTYYDVSHHALKFASYDGSKWNIHTVQRADNSDLGRYGKLLIVGGKPVVAYLAIQPGANGAVSSSVRVARATKDLPAAGTDWTFEDASVDPATPCRALFCATGSKCEASTSKCVKTKTGCNPKCASGQECLANASDQAYCADIVGTSKLDTYPDAAGDYVALAATPTGTLGIVFYDRLHGNLYQLKEVPAAGGADAGADDGGAAPASTWVKVLLDGQTAAVPPVDTGDVGVGAGLFIDSAGDWHVTYVDGSKESLKYLNLKGGVLSTAPELVDDGLGIAGTPFDDGQHIIGDDSFVTVNANGDVLVSYQDATAGTLHWAVGAKTSTAHTWTVKAVTQTGFAGAFSHHVTVGGATEVVNFWRKGDPVAKKTTSDATLVTP